MRIFGRNVLPEKDAATAGSGRAVADPTHNRDSEVLPQEWANPPHHENTDDEDADVKLVQQRYRDSAMHRRPIERDWVLSCAMTEGRQWLGWDDALHKVINLIDEAEPDRYVTDNQIGPLLTKSLALATMTRPDTSIAPESDAPIDQMAAAEAQAIHAHEFRERGGNGYTSSIAMWAAVCGVGYGLPRWDKNKLVDIPKYGPNGQIIGKVKLPLGGIEHDVISAFEGYLDPLAKFWKDVRWFIRAKVMPLSWFPETFGKVGKLVEPDMKDAYGGLGNSYLAGAFGGVSQLSNWLGGQEENKAALYLEMWERPSYRFPKGRYICVANNRRLTPANCAWPTPPGPNGEFPFARMVYKEGIGHPYGRGIVPDAIPLQVGMNRALSRATERSEADKLTVVLPKGAGVGADAYDTDEGRNVRKIYYDMEAGPGSFQQPPAMGADTWKLIDLYYLHLQNIFGVHDVNMGQSDPGASGYQVELLQQGDKTQLSSFTNSIEDCAVSLAQTEIALYGKYASASLPRMMSLDDTGNPTESRSRAMAFKALDSGGSVSVIVNPGSAIPTSPAGEEDRIMRFLEAGVFGPPATPQAGLIAATLLQKTRADFVTADVVTLLKQQIASQPNPAQVAQINAQSQQQIMQQKTQHEAQIAAIQEQQAEAKQQREAQTTVQIAQVKAQADAGQALEQNAHDARMALLDKIVPNLTGTMDPTAVVQLEKALGIEGAVPPPPKPALKNVTPKGN